MSNTNIRGRHLKLIIPGLLLAGMAVWSGFANATPGFGAAVSPLSKAATDAGVKIKTTGATDIINQQITLSPGGTTGWHAHPGYHIASVTVGELTVYDAEDDTCERRTYDAGQAVLHSPGDVHLMRNDSDVPVETYFTLILPAETREPRIDEPAPAACPDVS